MHRARQKSHIRRIMPVALGVTLLGAASVACADGDRKVVKMETVSSARAAEPEAAASSDISPDSDSQGLADTRMIIRNATVELEDKKPGEVVRRIEALTRKLGGFVVSSHSGAGEQEVAWANCIVRIPSSHFDQALGELSTFAKLRTQHVQGRDVTSEFVDVQARVNNKKRLEQRFAALTERTGEMSELLEVERELARVREEIEQLQGQAKYLRDSAAMSKLEVKVSRPSTFGGPLRKGLGAKLGDALETSWEGFGDLLSVLTVLLLGGLPLYVPVGAFVWFYRRRKARAKAGQQESTRQPVHQESGGYRAPDGGSPDGSDG